MAPETPISWAVSNWNCAIIRFDTVFDPAIKAPSAPTDGAKNGNTSPTLLATSSAIALGMDGRPDRLTPELIRMRTIGMVKISTKPAPSKVREDSPTAAFNSENFMRCRKKVASTTITMMPPGRYKNSMLPDRPFSPRILLQPSTRLFKKNAFTSALTRDSTSNPASSR